MPHAEPTKKRPPMVRQHHEGPAHTGCRLGRNRYVPEVIVSTFPALYQAKFALNGPQFPGLIRRAQTAQAGRVGMTLTTVQPGQDTTITTRKAAGMRRLVLAIRNRWATRTRRAASEQIIGLSITPEVWTCCVRITATRSGSWRTTRSATMAQSARASSRGDHAGRHHRGRRTRPDGRSAPIARSRYITCTCHLLVSRSSSARRSTATPTTRQAAPRSARRSHTSKDRESGTGTRHRTGRRAPLGRGLLPAPVSPRRILLPGWLPRGQSSGHLN